MRSILNNKLVVCGVLAALILIPLGLIGGLVQERQMRQAGFEADISRSGTGAQIVAGPVLVLPCTETWQEWTVPAPGVPSVSQQKTRDCTRHVLPERLAINGEVMTDTRRRGIYDVLVYTASLQIAGHFVPPAAARARHPHGVLSFDDAYVGVGIADPRGIADAPTLQFDGRTQAFEPGSRLAAIGPGIHAVPSVAPTPGATLSFSLGLQLHGMQQLSFLPLGRQTHASLTSTWQHPSFVGASLPVTRRIDADGFQARWASSFLATNIAEQFAAAAATARDDARAALFDHRFGVNFVPAVDVYLKSERATKYGILFVGICFVSLLLTEVLQRLRFHPVQYLMVAVALAIFFLLVLALSEHLGFLPAYVIASLACVGLIGFYLAHIMRHWRLAAGFSAVLSTLYALLYGLLSAEDYALLMGSLLVFGIVAAAMVLTRRIDWYALGAANRAAATE